MMFQNSVKSSFCLKTVGQQCFDFYNNFDKLAPTLIQIAQSTSDAGFHHRTVLPPSEKSTPDDLYRYKVAPRGNLPCRRTLAR